MKKLLSNKKFLSLYLLWILIHTFLLIQSNNSREGYSKDFWPFTSTEIGAYDISEWLVYVFSPIVIIFLIDAFKDNINKTFLIVFLALGMTAKGQMFHEMLVLPPDRSEIITAPVIHNQLPPLDLSVASAHRGIENVDLSTPSTYHENSAEDYRKEAQEDQRYWDNFAKQPASQQEQLQPTRFDWKNSNADRFVNSPCFHELGFNPSNDPQLQEKIYSDCEHEKYIDTTKKFTVIFIVAVSFVGFIIFGIRNNQSPKAA